MIKAIFEKVYLTIVHKEYKENIYKYWTNGLFENFVNNHLPFPLALKAKVDSSDQDPYTHTHAHTRANAHTLTQIYVRIFNTQLGAKKCTLNKEPKSYYAIATKFECSKLRDKKVIRDEFCGL